MKERFKQSVKDYFKPLSLLVAMIFLIEEALWNWTGMQMERLGAFFLIAYVENFIRKLHPYAALVAFLLPDLLIVPAKIVCMDLISHGYVFWGVVIFIVLKVVGMALFARIFNLTKPQLMTLSWFAKLHTKVVHYSDRIHAKLNEWELYQQMKQKLAELKLTFKEIVK